MKREGRQHGMVRTYRILPSSMLNQNTTPVHFINRIETRPTAGLFTKVSSKPTNHSKSTGLKRRKSKREGSNSSKKQQKIRLHSELAAYELAGVSASGILSYLYGSQEEEEEEEEHDLYDHYDDQDDEDDQQFSCCEVEDILKTNVIEVEPDGGEDDETQATNEDDVDLEEEEEEEEDDIVVDKDGGCVTIGQVVIVLEEDQIVDDDDEQDWCFVQADDQL